MSSKVLVSIASFALLASCTQESPGEIGFLETTGAPSGEEAGSADGVESDQGSADDDSDSAATMGDGDDDSGEDDSSDDGPLLDVLDDGTGDGGGSSEIPETCGQADLGQSTVGCEFYAVDMDTTGYYDDYQFAVAVANVQLDQVATVYVEVDDGNGFEIIAGPEEVDPLGLFRFDLPERHIEGSGVREGGAFRIVSDFPIAAYQFQPVAADTPEAEVNMMDASLLYPTAVWDTIHYLLGLPKRNDSQSAYATIVASVDGSEVTVTPEVDTDAGNGVPAGVAGVPFTISLDQGDVLQVATAIIDDEPTGTRIESNEGHPIAVFSGATCPPTPEGGCGYMEDQMFGARLWGTEFVASRVPIRDPSASAGMAEPSMWRIVASEDDTEITFEATAAVDGLPDSPQVLQAGEWLSLLVTGPEGEPGDFLVTSTKPIGVGNYMVGVVVPADLEQGDQPQGYGDLSLVQLAPLEQYLPRYVVLVPETCIFDFVTITRPAGAEIRIDDVAVSEADFIPVADGDYEVARVPLSDGVHQIDGDENFSVVILGYDDDYSYAYLGGAGTAVINPIPG